MQAMDSPTSPRIGGNNLFRYALLFILIASHVSFSASARVIRFLLRSVSFINHLQVPGLVTYTVDIQYVARLKHTLYLENAHNYKCGTKSFLSGCNIPDYAGGNGYKLILKLMDKDGFTADDFIGETSVSSFIFATI
ncbi:hypothetical protein MKW94_018328 [Papaver nudicaule]|uniref:Uncharacterized protein n=1 Tax=Papaver nudicaule TaxID=74823 RepID=A0AA41VPD8_PAPNU|nr:hypothetical protein [Papaver nudicaule]